MNTDSAEYANIVASFTREYAQARRSGMRPPSPAARRLLRQWLMRVLAGYWTHGGYVNWDTGLRLPALAPGEEARAQPAGADRHRHRAALAPRPDAPAWAKWMLDRGFEFYERQLARAGDMPPGLFFGVHAVPQPAESARLALARMPSNAARAIAAGLGSAPPKVPPPLYSFDPDTGRLAVTTPDYNTAVVPSSRGRVPVRRHRSRAALRRPPGGRGRDRRPAAGLLRAARARHLRPARVRLPAPATRAGCG